MTTLLEVFIETASLIDINPLERLYYKKLSRCFQLFPEMVKLRCVLATGEEIFKNSLNIWTTSPLPLL
jgi:hypothetical protein